MSRPRARKTRVAVVSALAVLALPAAAGAAVTTTFDAPTRTLTFTLEHSDQITVSTDAATSTYALNGASTGIPVAPDVNLAIVGGDGVNVIRVQTAGRDYGSLTIHGGAGGDVIFDFSDPSAGGRAQIFGDDGNDIVDVNTEGSVDISGGAGDDALEQFATFTTSPLTDVVHGDDGDDSYTLQGNGDAIAATIAATPSGGAHAHVATVDDPQFSTLDIDVAGAEQLDVEGTSDTTGDTISLSDGLGPIFSGGIVVDADAGDDTISGGDAPETLAGDDGNDTITGGGGSDLIEGGAGDDVFSTRDGVADILRGGAGQDSATADAIDGLIDVEHADVPAPAGPAPTPPPTVVKAVPATVAARGVKLVSSHGRLLARVPVSCPPSAAGCTTTLMLQTAKAVKLRGQARAVVVLGSARVALKAGQRGTATVALAGAFASLAAKGRIGARAFVVSTDAHGNAATSARTLTLTLPRARAHKRKARAKR